MINFKLRLSVGPEFNLSENPNQKVITVIGKIFKQNNINYKIFGCVASGSKIFFDKTIAENNISNGTVVLLMVDQNTPNNSLVNKNNSQMIPNNQLIRESLALLQQAVDFLVNGCKVNITLLDSRGHCLGWNIGRKSGPPGYLKNYSPPLDFIGVGLKCFNMYDNGDNSWIGDKNQKGEWYIAYHAIKSLEALNGILNVGFRRGAFQECEDLVNINPLTSGLYPKCGRGVYFIPDFSEAKSYAQSFMYKGKYFEIVLMCRVNPTKVRIAKILDDLESWIVNGDDLNLPNGRKYDDEVRINRILVHMHDKK